MKRPFLILLLLLLLTLFESNAQVYFNKRLTVHSIYSVFTNVRIINDKYYVLGNAADSIYLNTNIYAQSIKFSVFDLQGNLLRDTFYRKDSFNVGFYYNDAVVTDSGNIIFPVQAINNTDAFTALLCMDTMGHLLWERDYPKPICTDNIYYHTYDLKPTGTGEWLMASRVTCTYVSYPYQREDILLTKLDSAFNIIWNKTFGLWYWNDWPGKILVEPDGYLLSGTENNFFGQQTGFNSKAELIKVDTAGNEIWSWKSDPNKKINKALDVIRTQDGGYVYCGQGDGVEVYLGSNWTELRWHSWIEKLDINRNVVWNKSFSRLTNTESNEQRLLKEMPNGDIVIGGMVDGGYEQTDTPAQVFGSLIKLTANGDLVWARKYMAPDQAYLFHSIADMQQTDDGGYILVGDATDYAGMYGDPIQRGWIVRVDSNGCEQSGGLCNPTQLTTTKPKSKELKIYPNPANDVLYIEDGETAIEYRLINITGSTVRTGRVNDRRGSVDMKDLAPGVYILHAGGGVYKVIKE